MSPRQPPRRHTMSLLAGGAAAFAVFVGVLAAAACEKESAAPTAPPVTSGSPVAATVPPVPAVKAAKTRHDLPPPRPVYDVKTKCTDSCLLLMDTPFDEVANGGYCKLCAPYDEVACELDWPSSDVPPCSHYDYMRNCIYAGYGRAFKSPVYQKAFAKRAWYQKDPNYDDKNIPPVAKANARRLRKIVADGQCSPG